MHREGPSPPMPCIGSRLQPSPKTCRLINPSQRGDRGRCSARSQLRPPAYGILTAEERPRSRASLGEDEVEAFGSRWMSQKSSCATARRGRFTAALHLIPSMSHGPDRLAAEPGTGKGTEVLGSRRGSAAITNSVKSGGRRSLPTYLLIAGPSGAVKTLAPPLPRRALLHRLRPHHHLLTPAATGPPPPRAPR